MMENLATHWRLKEKQKVYDTTWTRSYRCSDEGHNQPKQLGLQEMCE